MKRLISQSALFGLACAVLATIPGPAQTLLAKGTLTGSKAGAYTDLSGLNGTLENGAPASLLGGLGSGLAYASGNTFLALPDRGPNAVSFDALIDDTASYIDRFHTVRMKLHPSATGSALPFTLAPELESTTLLYSSRPLHYGTGAGLNVGSGRPAENRAFVNYFTGRSDNFNPNDGSGDAFDARLDPESIRVSNDGKTVFISDEYGPYVYQFLRSTGQRVRSYSLPPEFYVATKATTGDAEISDNTSGRVANKGMEGLAITPDGRTLVGIVQAPLIQDSAEGGAAAKLLRLVAINVKSGKVRGEYAYLLTTGSGVSDITALNDHEFLVDERDGKGLGDGSTAKVKQFFRIDLANATDISGMNGTQAANVAVAKTLVLDLVKLLTANGVAAAEIPAKIEGSAFGPDIKYKGDTYHTLWIANDNDFLQNVAGPNTNPNHFFVVGLTDANLGSVYVPQFRNVGQTRGEGK
jgi:hypothetical protein